MYFRERRMLAMRTTNSQFSWAATRCSEQRRAFNEVQSPVKKAEHAVAGKEEAAQAQQAGVGTGLTGKKGCAGRLPRAEQTGRGQLLGRHVRADQGWTDNAKTAWHNVVEAQKAADVEQYEAYREALENQIAASKMGSQQRVQLEQALTDYVRSVWGEQSKEYAQAMRARVTADREWKEEQKKAVEEASRALDEYKLKMAELKDQGKQDEALGGVAMQETNVRGKAQLGLIDPKQETAQLAATR
jgi:hypothetical protein